MIEAVINRLATALAVLVVVYLAVPVLAVAGLVAVVLALVGRVTPAHSVLLLSDMILNVALAGRPGETVSRRLARLRRDGTGTGQRAGCWLCAVLTYLAHRLHGGRLDHCTEALADDGRSYGAEWWHWSRPEDRG